MTSSVLFSLYDDLETPGVQFLETWIAFYFVTFSLFVQVWGYLEKQPAVEKEGPKKALFTSDEDDRGG